MRIRDTTAGIGDGTWAVGPGTLILRLPSDDGNNVAAGAAEILYYENTINFIVEGSTFTPTVTTTITAFSPVLGDTDNTTAQASGDLTLGDSPSIAWNTCDYPDGWNDDNESFTPDIEGTGDGCLAPYRSVGNINCSGSNCSAGGLEEGDNPQDETWEQRMETLTFSSDLSTFTMPFMLLPNRSPSRTYLSWDGTLDSKVCN
jgi:hypothetical protein